MAPQPLPDVAHDTIGIRPTRLADGRELIYVDDAGSSLPAERNLDSRQLHLRPATASMRDSTPRFFRFESGYGR